jgi:phosphopantothenoylcysteine decarboxylase/phosphopantothenate--cysteine ligase
MLNGQRPIALGITGCIGAYKAPELLRRLQKYHYDVHPVVTDAALKFVTKTTLDTLSGHSTVSSLWNESTDVDVKHISLSDKIEGLLVAPATANILAKFACGIADDFLSTLYISATCPVIIAPAMNEKMWLHAATRKNIETLKTRGVHFIEPGSGWLACGWEGKGRLADLDQIVEMTDNILCKDPYLSGKKILISVGPTREYLDPMRFISNKSSGKMGMALARIATKFGAEVRVVSGPVSVDIPKNIHLFSVENAEEMHKAMLQNANWADVIIMSAAVADYKPASVSDSKIKKEERDISIPFTRTVDIISDLAKTSSGKIIVGFAAETDNLREHAFDKLKNKKIDLIVANKVGGEDGVAGIDTTAGLIIDRQGRERGIGTTSKYQMAEYILEEVKTLLDC